MDMGNLCSLCALLSVKFLITQLSCYLYVVLEDGDIHIYTYICTHIHAYVSVHAYVTGKIHSST